MFQQLNEMLTPGSSIHLVISKVNGQLQVISNVQSDNKQMPTSFTRLNGSADEMQAALLDVLSSKCEVVSTIQDQVAAAKLQDKQAVAKAISKSVTASPAKAQSSGHEDEESDGEAVDGSDGEGNEKPPLPAAAQAPQPAAASTLVLF